MKGGFNYGLRVGESYRKNRWKFCMCLSRTICSGWIMGSDMSLMVHRLEIYRVGKLVIY